MKKNGIVLISILAALVVGIIIMVSTQQGRAYSNAYEYKEFTGTGASSTTGKIFQGDVLFCCWNTSGGAFSGTVKVQIYHSYGAGGAKGEWIDTGDTFTGEGCKILTVPENGVRMRAYTTVSSGSIRVRISQEYPPKTFNVGR